MSRLLDIGRDVVARARTFGADEVSVSVTRATDVSLQRRAGKIEQATQATSLGVSLSLLVGDRYSVHSTSDLRTEPLDDFLRRAIAATRVLEPEVERRQPDLALCGRGASEATLDLFDDTHASWTAEERRDLIRTLEETVDALPNRSRIKSATVSLGDNSGDSVRVMSNGFEGEHRGTGYGMGVEITLEEPGGRRPEAWSYYSAAHRSDLPPVATLAEEAWKRAEQRLGSKSIASGRYPMLLQNHAVGRILGVLGGPLSGSELHQGRSCLAGKIDTKIASSNLTIEDDPFIPRGLGSRAWDGDALRPMKRPILEEGVLRNYYLNVYYARKLGLAPTSGGRSNWVVRPGTRTPQAILTDLPKCIVVTGFLGGNSNGLTGDFSFGIQGLLVEHGEVTAHLSEMNVSGNLFETLGAVAEPASDVWAWSSVRTPSLLFDGIQFSGS